MNKNKNAKILLFALLIASSSTSAVAEQSVASFSEAISGGAPLVEFRARYEHNQQDSKADDATAFTLRSLIGWQTKAFNDFSATAQLIDISRLDDNYDSFRKGGNEPGKSNYPVIVDTRYSGFYQLFVDYKGWSETLVRAGRQPVMLDDGRFFGRSDLRQRMRAFDGVSMQNTSLADTTIYAAHFWKFNQPTSSIVDANVDVLHANYKLTPTEKVSTYAYFYDNDFTDSSRTLGFRLDGSHAMKGSVVNDSPLKVLYTAEYASQDNYKGSSNTIDAHYIHLGTGVGSGDWMVRIDREIFSSNNGIYAFQTPTGNSHQGNADLFGAIPSDGIKDTAFSVRGKFNVFSLSAAYHWLDADRSFATPTGFGQRIDEELNLSIAYQFNKQLSTSIDYVDFREKDIRVSGRYPDIQKIWLTLLYEY